MPPRKNHWHDRNVLRKLLLAGRVKGTIRTNLLSWKYRSVDGKLAIAAG
jgi:hypothetical protein